MEEHDADAQRKGDCRGFTLVETLIAVLLISVVVTSVFSLALTAKISSVKTERRASGMFYVRRTTEKLKAYVTADKTAAVAAAMGAPVDWKLPEDACNSGLGTCSAANCWALEICTHDVTAMLPAALSGAPINAKLAYTVTSACDSCAKTVTFSYTWDE